GSRLGGAGFQRRRDPVGSGVRGAAPVDTDLSTKTSPWRPERRKMRHRKGAKSRKIRPRRREKDGHGAESGTRTRTPFRTMVFETIASTIPPSRRTVVPDNLTG